MKIIILLAFYALTLTSAIAQTGKISGTVSQGTAPAEGATVALLRAKDSATVKLTVSNKAGIFLFENIGVGKYLVSVTSVAHRKAVSKIFELTGVVPVVEVPAITLVALPKSMADVSVTTKRPLVEQKVDRTIINVDASITNVGTSALEVLEKSPGVSVDRDGNITLKGKAGLIVMVDGRPTQLAGTDLANMLRSMSSNQLDQIEIMTNPPARYDASGNAGVINIKTKKIIKAGINGSANVGYTEGKYPKTNEGFNFNYREGKVNLFTNLSHNYQKRYSILTLDRNIYNDNTGSLQNIFNQEANSLSKGNSYTAKFGVDFFATAKTTLGAVVNINNRDLLQSNPNITNISNASKVLQSTTTAAVDNNTNWRNISTNLNYRKILDKGKEISSDIDFLKYTSDNDLFMVNSYTNAAGNPSTKADTLKGFLPQDINVYSARVDYVQPINKTKRFEAGVKTSFVRTDNNANYDSIQNGTVVHDLTRSNHFVYEENINAAYVSLNTSLSKKWNGQFGLRLENTNAKGLQKTTGDNFDRHYTQLFPTAYFQYKADDKNNFGINFGRRVSRPSYESLNPFIRFIDRYTFSQGNPALKPSVSNNIELTHTWRSMITTTVNYTIIKDVVQSIIQQKGQDAYRMPANVSTLNQFGIAVNANTPVTKWWTSNLNFFLFNNNFKGDVNNIPIDRSATSFFVNGAEQFKVNKTLSAEVNGTYRSGGVAGVMKMYPMWFIGAGISQQVLKNKGTLRFSARDIFKTQKLRALTLYGNVDVDMRQVSESQVVTLSFSYSFSKGKKIAPVKRTQGSAKDEQDRIDN